MTTTNFTKLAVLFRNVFQELVEASYALEELSAGTYQLGQIDKSLKLYVCTSKFIQSHFS